MMQKEPLPLDIATDLPKYMAESRERLEAKMVTVARKARKKKLADVSLENDVCDFAAKERRRNPPLRLPRRPIG